MKVKALHRAFWIVSFLILLFGNHAASAADRYEQLFRGMLTLAVEGNPEAQYHLGMMHNNGIGTEANPSEAFEWFRKSAASGDPLAAYKVGCYYDGQFPGVVPENNVLGLKYKLVAAEQGYHLAQTSVAEHYYAAQQYDEAIRWWTEAAKQGEPTAIRRLSTVYEQGEIAPRDLALSYRYLLMLAQMPDVISDQSTKVARDAVFAQLSPEQLTEASAAGAFVAQPTPLTQKAQSGLMEAIRLYALNPR